MPQPLCVLIAEDNPHDAELLVRGLRRAGFDPDWERVDTEAAFLERIRPELDIILSDYAMPRFGGLRALELIKARGLDVPFIIISGTIGEDTAVEAMKQGAADYLLKDRLARLGTAVQQALEQTRTRRECERAEKAMQESEHKYRHLFESLSEAAFLIDRGSRRVLDGNLRAEQLLGRTRTEILGMKACDLFSPARAAASCDVVTGRTQGIEESEIQGKGGATIPVLVSAAPIQLHSRDLVLVLMTDITERKQAEAELRLSDLALRSVSQGVIITGPDHLILSANPAFAAITGYPEAEVLGRNCRFLQGARTDPQTVDAIRAALRAGTGFAGEILNYRKDGTPFCNDLSISPLRDAGGRVTHFIGITRDVSERKRTGERFRRLVDSNAQGVLFWNVNGAITGANDAFLHIVGYCREDLEAGRINWMKMTPPEHVEADQRALRELAATGVCAPFEKEYLRKDGTRVPILIGAAVFEDNPEEGVCFVLDLTERKQLERQFLRAQRMESIGTLAGGIAHDLNNVLSPIMMSIELLKMRFPDPSSEELLSIISSSAQRGAEMISQVLTFARGVEGRRVEVQVRYLVQDIAKLANETFLKHIEVHTVLPHDLWTVLGDPTQLHQVLLNLCVNARDAMPGGGTFTISAENLLLDAQYAGLNLDAQAGPYVHRRITDTGTGIPPEVIEQIFDPFFTTKEVGKGTGLGLSTSLAIVKSHGGFLRVASEPGRGTTFQVYLPALLESSGTGAGARAEAELPRGHGELILVVDDEASVRQITGQSLEAFGYCVLLAGDGAEAVALFAERKGEIAAVLIDMMMPVMDGPATIQVLHKLDPGIPILAASGLSSRAQVAEAARLGVQDFLPKPYTAEALLKLLQKILFSPAARARAGPPEERTR